MKELESWEYGNPEHVAMRREQERKKNPAMKNAFEKARVEAEKLFKARPNNECK